MRGKERPHRDLGLADRRWQYGEEPGRRPRRSAEAVGLALARQVGSMHGLGTRFDQAEDIELSAVPLDWLPIIVQFYGVELRARVHQAIGKAGRAAAPQHHQVRPAGADDVSRQEGRGQQREQQFLF